MRSSPPTLRDRPCRPCVSQPSLLVPTLTSLRHDTQKATAGPQMPTTVCFNWFIQSPVIGIWQKGWRHPESSAKGPDDGTALSTQRPPRGKPASLGQCGSVGPLGSWLPRLGLCSGVDKWGAGEDRNHKSFAKTQGTGEGNAQMPERWRPSATDGSAIRGTQGLR